MFTRGICRTANCPRRSADLPSRPDESQLAPNPLRSASYGESPVCRQFVDMPLREASAKAIRLS